jgi:arabinofuranosyltransferase
VIQRNPIDRQSIIVLLVAIALFCISSLYMMDYIPDDTYISFRYAEHLAGGHGLTFNISEQPVEAYSNLLWILLCAVLFKLGLDLPSVMPGVGVAVGALSLVVLWVLFRRRRMPPLQMLFPLLLVASCGPFIMYTVSGMEMPLYSLLLLVSVLFLDRVLEVGGLLDILLLSAAGVLAALCRPEGAIVLPVIIAGLLWPMRKGTGNGGVPRPRTRSAIVAAAVFVVAMVAYHVWRIGYFGEVLPTPLLSKGGAGISIVDAWRQNIGIYFVEQGYYLPPLGFYLAALILMAVLGAKLSPAKTAEKRTEHVALMLVIAHVFVYVNFKDWMPGMRYHAPLAALLILPAAQVQSPFFGRAPMKKGAFWLVGMAVMLLNYTVLGELRIVANTTESSNRVCRVALGEWLRKTMPAGTLIAISDVGAVPYYSGFDAIDIHPQSLTDLWIAKHGFSVDYVFGRHPDVFIIPSRGIFSAKWHPEHFALGEDQRFSAYRFIGVSRNDWYHDRCYWVYLPADYPRLTDEQYESFPQGLGSMRRVAR